MNSKLKTFLICIAIPLLVGITAGLITNGSMGIYEQLQQPPLAPPGRVFPVVWTILYVLMGIASYLVLTSDADHAVKRNALFVYGMQLAVNFIWPILFFSLGWYLFSFAWIILLWVLILVTTAKFLQISTTAGLLLVPYLFWVIFAAYLNLGIYLLN